MNKLVFVLLFILLIPASVNADEWVSIVFDSTGLQVKGESSVSQASNKPIASFKSLNNIPFIKVQWLDAEDKLIKQKNMTDPRAFWAPMDEHGKHAGVFLRSDGDFMLKKPSKAEAVIIEFLDNGENRQVSNKLQFD